MLKKLENCWSLFRMRTLSLREIKCFAWDLRASYRQGQNENANHLMTSVPFPLLGQLVSYSNPMEQWTQKQKSWGLPHCWIYESIHQTLHIFSVEKILLSTWVMKNFRRKRVLFLLISYCFGQQHYTLNNTRKCRRNCFLIRKNITDVPLRRWCSITTPICSKTVLFCPSFTFLLQRTSKGVWSKFCPWATEPWRCRTTDLVRLGGNCFLFTSKLLEKVRALPLCLSNVSH